MGVPQEILAKVKQLAPAQQRTVLDFVDFLHQRAWEAEHRALAEAGGQLAAEVWPVEDFSDWIEKYPPKPPRGRGRKKRQ